jgi:hypothetical protein
LQINAHAERVTDIIFAHIGEQFVNIDGQIRKVEVAVGINQHEYVP